MRKSCSFLKYPVILCQDRQPETPASGSWLILFDLLRFASQNISFHQPPLATHNKSYSHTQNSCFSSTCNFAKLLSHKANAQPVNRCSSFVVGQSRCAKPWQQWQLLYNGSFMALPPLPCPFGCFTVCHTACCSSSFLTAAPVFFTHLSSFLPSFRFISPRSYLCVASCRWNAFASPPHWDQRS